MSAPSWLLRHPVATVSLYPYAQAAQGGGDRRQDLGGIAMSGDLDSELPHRRPGTHQPPAAAELQLRGGLSDAMHDTDEDSDRRRDVWAHILSRDVDPIVGDHEPSPHYREPAG